MRHGHGLRKLNRTSSHRLAMLRNMMNSLIAHEAIKTIRRHMHHAPAQPAAGQLQVMHSGDQRQRGGNPAGAGLARQGHGTPVAIAQAMKHPAAALEGASPT